MSDSFEQVPFHDIVPYDAAIFAENPEQRCPCLLLLDVSGSMSGQPIAELNEGLKQFKDELLADPLAAKRVEVAIVTFGPVDVVVDFQSADTFQPPHLVPRGDTPMGAAIERSLALVQARKEAYRQNGIDYYRPWVFLITDGAPTDSWQRSAALVREGEATRQFQFFAVGVQGANFEILKQISSRDPLKLSGLRFRDLFSWLSKSLGAVSHSQPGEAVGLAPIGWGTVG